MKLRMLAIAALAVAVQAVAGETTQLTDKQVDALLRQSRMGSFAVGDVDLPGDPAEPVPRFKPFKMSTETNVQEAVWQAMNVVDMLQTIQIAKNPACYYEAGTLSLLYGSRISKSDAIVGSAIFAVLHYATTRGIERLIEHDDDYRVLQRVWQYTGYAWKGHALANNHRIGLRLDSSKAHAGPDGVCRR